MFSAPMENPETTVIPVAQDESGRHVRLPQFKDYAALDLRIVSTSH